MSYSIYFLNDDEGEAERRESVLTLLEQRSLTANEYGWIEVGTDDGGWMSLSIRDDELHSFLATESVWLSPQLAELIYEIALRGYDVVGDNCEQILTTDAQRVVDDPDMPTVLCLSAQDLYDRINQPFEGWVEYREQVISDLDRGVVRRMLDRLLGR